MEDNKTYRVPEDCNPFISADRVRALTDALHQLVPEGDVTRRPAPHSAYASLISLMDLLQPEVHALHDYLGEIENRGKPTLPLTDAEFDALDEDGVREAPALYVVR